MNMKTGIIAGVVFAGIVLGFFVGRHARSPSLAGGPIEIAVLTPVSHPSLDESISGFRAFLKSAGYNERKTKFVIYNAQHQDVKLPSLIDRIIASKPALVFSLTTGVTVQAAGRIPASRQSQLAS